MKYEKQKKSYKTLLLTQVFLLPGAATLDKRHMNAAQSPMIYYPLRSCHPGGTMPPPQHFAANSDGYQYPPSYPISESFPKAYLRGDREYGRSVLKTNDHIVGLERSLKSIIGFVYTPGSEPPVNIIPRIKFTRKYHPPDIFPSKFYPPDDIS